MRYSQEAKELVQGIVRRRKGLALAALVGAFTLGSEVSAQQSKDNYQLGQAHSRGIVITNRTGTSSQGIREALRDLELAGCNPVHSQALSYNISSPFGGQDVSVKNLLVFCKEPFEVGN